MRAIAILLIVVGILMTTITGYDVIREKRVADIGPLHVTKEEHTPVYWNPWAGIILVVAGAAVLLSSGRGRNIPSV